MSAKAAAKLSPVVATAYSAVAPWFSTMLLTASM